MKKVFQNYGKATFLFLICCFFILSAFCQGKGLSREYYEIKIYHIKNSNQEVVVDNYLKNAFIPALHKAGIHNIGVFKPLANDTASEKLICVYIPGSTIELLVSIPDLLQKDATYNMAGKDYLDAEYSNPPYSRIEFILLKAFPLAPKMQLPKLASPHQDHIYELRSYESATEKLYVNKVQMFNQGGEIALFKRLNFNAVFYAEVMSGCHMPNLMYMTSFENKNLRDEFWKTFGADPEWKRLSALPEYQHNVSKADIILMHAAEYSDF